MNSSDILIDLQIKCSQANVCQNCQDEYAC